MLLPQPYLCGGAGRSHLAAATAPAQPKPSVGLEGAAPRALGWEDGAARDRRAQPESSRNSAGAF